jgi:hypothetical protein
VSDHTATPWHFRGTHIVDRAEGADNARVIALLLRPRIEANGNLIVQAVNSHDTLLAACKGLMGVLREHPVYTAGAPYGAGYALEQADAAIAAAERGTE